MLKFVHYLVLLSLFIPTQNIAKDFQKLGIPTGSSTGTYIQFGKNIKEIVEKKHKAEIDIWVRESKGSVENIEMLASKGENAALAIVQSDVIGHFKKSGDSRYEGYARNLRLIFPFYNEEVHLLGNKEIKNITDLEGKKVVVGPIGSGTSLTAWNLLHLMNVKPKEFINASYEEAIDKVVTGEADAMFSVSGKPVKIFTTLSQMANEDDYKDGIAKIHFIPLDEKIMLSEYVEGELTPDDYSIIQETVPTVAVKAVLVAFDFSQGTTEYYQTRCSQLRKIATVIRQNIDILKENKTAKWHKKWNEVNLSQTISGWKRDACSHSDVKPENSDSSTKISLKCKLNPNAEGC